MQTSSISENSFGVVGYGYVGRATHFGLLKNQKIIIHDINLGTSLENLKNLTDVFVCVPTSNDHDVSLMIQEIKKIIEINPNVQITIRSTLPIGVGKRIQDELNIKIIYIPEFLRERFWEEDCLRRPLIVGHDGIRIPKWLEKEQIQECSISEAEIVKMFSNNFAVMRIAFANLFYDICQNTNSNYETVKDLYFKVAHNQSYMEVPGHDGTRGFGGKCLPKDLDFMIETLRSLSIRDDWFKQIRELNKKWQEKF